MPGLKIQKKKSVIPTFIIQWTLKNSKTFFCSSHTHTITLSQSTCITHFKLFVIFNFRVSVNFKGQAVTPSPVFTLCHCENCKG